VKPKKKSLKRQDQPRRHAAKNRAVSALRRKRIIKDIVGGKTLKQAGVNAGLNRKTAESQVSQILKEPKVQSQFRELLDKAVPDELHTNTYKECIEATKVISANVIAPNGQGMADAHSLTKDFIEVPDYQVRLKAADSIAKLKGHLLENTNPTGEFRIKVIYEDE